MAFCFFACLVYLAHCIYKAPFLSSIFFFFFFFLHLSKFDFKMSLFLHIQAELRVDAFVIRSGRNVTVIGVEFKMRETSKLLYTAHATFYTMPKAKL